MPALSNIQTYVSTSQKSYQSELLRFQRVLISLGIWNHNIELGFKEFEWVEEEDNGFVYSSLIRLNYVHNSKLAYAARPLAMVQPVNDASSWFCFELLSIAEDQVEVNQSTNTFYYKNNVLEFVRKLAHAFHEEFKETGTYFTDEAQDGIDFEGLTQKDSSKLWNFDFAIIPNTLKGIYSEVPETHKIIEYQDYFEAYYFEKWPALNI